jgi:tyrosine-specific transport protein
MEKAVSARRFDSKFVTAISLVTGTSIGAGMLGLPVETATAGFFPSTCLFLLTWFITIASGLLFAEVILFNPPRSNYISISKRVLGNKITLAVFGLYILLFYSLIAAYTKGIGVILSDDFHLVGTPWNGSLCFILAFLPLMYFGTHLIGRLNSFLTCILLLSFVLLLSIGNQNLSWNLLTNQNWSHSLFSLPLIISSFGFHGTLPSLIDYLDRDKKKIQLAIIVGSTLTLLIYLSWELFILGSIPLTGATSLLSAWENDQTAITPLSQLSGSSLISHLAHIFSLSAIITSFFGVSIGLVDFLIDAFQMKRSTLTKTSLLLSLYLSALLLSMTDLRIFYLSLNYGAGFAGIFLLIFLPAYMMHRSRQTTGRALLPPIFLFSAISVLGCLLGFFRF